MSRTLLNLERASWKAPFPFYRKMNGANISPEDLIRWFSENKKPYFFRFNRTPYRVWVSEVVLQQTRMSYALPRLKRFLDRFPDVRALACAKESEVLLKFEGLGYYNRAVKLHEGARYIHKELNGKFPESYREMLTIPSIGPYTAAAVSSICFGESRVAIDGNLKRIYARLCLADEEVKSPGFQKKCADYFETVFSDTAEHPGVLNEALMELGQTICSVQNPRCDICPVSGACRAYYANKTKDYPKRSVGGENKEVVWLLFMIQQKKKILLQRSRQSYFLKNQWAFPSILYFPKQKTKLASYQKSFPKGLKNRMESTANGLFTGLKADPKKKEAAPGTLRTSERGVRHTITTHKIFIHTHVMKTTQQIAETGEIQWCSPDRLLSKLPSRAMRKALPAIHEALG